MYHRDGHIVNSVKDAKKVALTFGGLENLITLSLSQALAYKRIVQHLIIRPTGQVRLSWHLRKGGRSVFCPQRQRFIQLYLT